MGRLSEVVGGSATKALLLRSELRQRLTLRGEAVESLTFPAAFVRGKLADNLIGSRHGNRPAHGQEPARLETTLTRPPNASGMVERRFQNRWRTYPAAEGECRVHSKGAAIVVRMSSLVRMGEDRFRAEQFNLASNLSHKLCQAKDTSLVRDLTTSIRSSARPSR